eukprot:GDKJ01003626.1.p1 GENE.GDKJ01003626.1~~GDKJ01003626.1.p1  ORF type:complete len:617 (-),score=131.62 GDKJ01003626.1:112-1962(-)
MSNANGYCPHHDPERLSRQNLDAQSRYHPQNSHPLAENPHMCNHHNLRMPQSSSPPSKTNAISQPIQIQTQNDTTIGFHTIGNTSAFTWMTADQAPEKSPGFPSASLGGDRRSKMVDTEHELSLKRAYEHYMPYKTNQAKNLGFSIDLSVNSFPFLELSTSKKKEVFTDVVRQLDKYKEHETAVENSLGYHMKSGRHYSFDDSPPPPLAYDRSSRRNSPNKVPAPSSARGNPAKTSKEYVESLIFALGANAVNKKTTKSPSSDEKSSSFEDQNNGQKSFAVKAPVESSQPKTASSDDRNDYVYLKGETPYANIKRILTEKSKRFADITLADQMPDPLPENENEKKLNGEQLNKICLDYVATKCPVYAQKKKTALPAPIPVEPVVKKRDLTISEIFSNIKISDTQRTEITNNAAVNETIKTQAVASPSRVVFFKKSEDNCPGCAFSKSRANSPCGIHQKLREAENNHVPVPYVNDLPDLKVINNSFRHKSIPIKNENSIASQIPKDYNPIVQPSLYDMAAQWQMSGRQPYETVPQNYSPPQNNQPAQQAPTPQPDNSMGLQQSPVKGGGMANRNKSSYNEMTHVSAGLNKEYAFFEGNNSVPQQFNEVFTNHNSPAR